MTNFLFILLEIGMPIASWLGIIVGIISGLLCYLLKESHNRLKKDIEHIAENLSCTTKAVETERARSDKEMRAMDTRINDLHINILNKLDEIKFKFNEFRK